MEKGQNQNWRLGSCVGRDRFVPWYVYLGVWENERVERWWVKNKTAGPTQFSL